MYKKLKSFFEKKYKYIKSKIDERNFIISLLSSKKQFIKSGKYSIDRIHSKIIIYIPSEKGLFFLNKNKSALLRNSRGKRLFKSNIKSKIDNVLLRKIIIQHENKSNFQGELIMITREKDVKIFDLNREKVLTFCSSHDIFLKRKKTHSLFRNDFLMPKISFGSEDLTILEDLINYIPYPHWNNSQKEVVINN